MITFLTAEQAEPEGITVATGEVDSMLRDIISGWFPPAGGEVLRAQFLVKGDEIEVGVVVMFPHIKGNRIWAKTYVNAPMTLDPDAAASFVRHTLDRGINFRLDRGTD